MSKNICVVHQLGLVPYPQAWELQSRLAAEIADGSRPPTLLLLEHPHTYTFGRRGQPENLLWEPAELSRRGISVEWVDRGGDVTYHGPGQLVGYPLLPLAPGGLRAQADGRLPQADYVGYVRKLESTLILALMKFGIPSGQIKGLTGVWVQPHLISRSHNCSPEQSQHPAKVAAIGVKVDVKGISRHGFAINVNPDMSYWEGIIGCGLKEYPVTCLACLHDPPPPMQQVSQAVITALGQIFGYEMVIKPGKGLPGSIMENILQDNR